MTARNVMINYSSNDRKIIQEMLLCQSQSSVIFNNQRATLTQISFSKGKAHLSTTNHPFKPQRVLFSCHISVFYFIVTHI